MLLLNAWPRRGLRCTAPIGARTAKTRKIASEILFDLCRISSAPTIRNFASRRASRDTRLGFFPLRRQTGPTAENWKESKGLKNWHEKADVRRGIKGVKIY